MANWADCSIRLSLYVKLYQAGADLCEDSRADR